MRFSFIEIWLIILFLWQFVFVNKDYDHEANKGLEPFVPMQSGEFITEPTPDSTTENRIEDLRSNIESDDESCNTRSTFLSLKSLWLYKIGLLLHLR